MSVNSYDSYNDMVTRVTRSISASADLTDYVINRICYRMEEGEKKSLILGLYTKARKLGSKVNNLLFFASLGDGVAGPGELEKLCNLTDTHWEALQELYRAIGQDEYDRKMRYSEVCVNSHEWRETAKEELEPFYPRETAVSSHLSG